MLLTFPIGYLNRYIKNTYLRLWYGLICGFILQYQMYGMGKTEIYFTLGILHIIVATLNTYLFIKFFGRKYSAFTILIINIIQLSYLHIMRMLTNYGGWRIEIDALYMMSICKFSSIAFSYEDGGKDPSEILSSYHRAK
jgi:hypothetical protein